MTASETVSVKIPETVLQEIPAPGNGRSKFILQAIEEKIARRKAIQWRPKTARGRRMAALLKKGTRERTPVLSDAQIEQELSARRGRAF